MKTLPDIIKATRIINYDGGSIAEAFEDDEQTLANVIDMALDYAVEDLGNNSMNFYLEAEWLDDNGETIKIEEYNEAGQLISKRGVLVRLSEDDEIAVSYGTEYVDPDAEYAYICAVADTIRTMHVVAVNEETRPIFKVLDDEGIIIEPGYNSLNLAIIAAKGWLS